MADMKSKVKHAFDADASVTLRNGADGNETADVSEVGIPIPALVKAYWDNNELAHQTIACVFHVTTLDRTTGDETYILNIQTDSELAFGDAPVIVGSITIPDVTGVYVVNLDADTMLALDPDAAFMRVSLDVNGTTPIIGYSAWIVNAVT